MHDSLVAWRFTATAPNVTWLTGITEHPPREGKLYLCAVKNCCSNRIVGYSISHRMKSTLAIATLRNAIALHDFHADQALTGQDSDARSRGISQRS